MGLFSRSQCSFWPQLHGLMLHKSTKTTIIFSPGKQMNLPVTLFLTLNYFKI